MLWSGSETPERQQDSSPCQAKSMPKECFTLPLEPIKNNALVRLRNTRTPARFEPMPGKTQAERMLHVTFEAHKKTMLWSGSETPERQQDSSPCQAKSTPKECFTLPFKPIKNNALVRFRNTRTPAGFEPMPSKKHAERMLHVTFGTHKKQCSGPVPKHPNASRIRAHARQNAGRKNASRYLWNP